MRCGPTMQTQMSSATAGIYCTTSLPLSHAMEDSSMSSSCKSSIAEGTVSTSQRMFGNFVERSRRSRTPATRRGRRVGTMAKCQTATDEQASQP